MAESEIAWLAGLIEGEGSFWNRSKRYCAPVVQLAMTDEDVVIRAAIAMGATKVVQESSPTKAGKLIYRTNVYGAAAIELMERLLPYMGKRRTQKIAELLVLRETAPSSPYSERRAYSRGLKIVWSALQ